VSEINPTGAIRLHLQKSAPKMELEFIYCSFNFWTAFPPSTASGVCDWVPPRIFLLH